MCEQFGFEATDRIKLVKALKLLPNAEVNKKVVKVVIGAEEQKIMDELSRKKESNDYNLQCLQNAINGILYEEICNIWSEQFSDK